MAERQQLSRLHGGRTAPVLRADAGLVKRAKREDCGISYDGGYQEYDGRAGGSFGADAGSLDAAEPRL